MFSNFWNTTKESAQDNVEMQPVTSDTMESPRQSCASPYPIQPASDKDHDSQKPVRSKIPKPIGFNVKTTGQVPGHLIPSTGSPENLMEVDTVTIGLIPDPLLVSTGPLEKLMEPNTLAVPAMAPKPPKTQAEAQRNQSQSPTPQLDMQKRRAK
ncbi:hypothetical protein BYT27DRAFT_7216503 [Phlegmacium glaucopus]|nr:hypothetical protein BYT27DRAFT_7216503 [Phlegmacium glaucopus]